MHRFLLCVTFAFFALLAPLQAQSQAALSGQVVDPSGAVIPGAAVKVSQGNRVIMEGQSDSTGNFSFDLAVGEYRVEVTVPEFKPHAQNVRVTANMPPLSIPLAVATVNAAVDVAPTEDKVSLEQDANLTSTTITGDSGEMRVARPQM